MADNPNHTPKPGPGGQSAVPLSTGLPNDLSNGQTAEDFKRMVADYMEAGYLENIVDLMRADKSALKLIPVLAADHRPRVRIGAAALVESLIDDMRPDIRATASLFQPTIENPEPTIQADAVYILSIIGGAEALRMLRYASGSPHPLVRKAALEAIEEIV